MKIKRLEITGFKSFVDKTAIEFPIGISAIVGPNGCGKSNIIDALRWVMGEQSIKQLRGKAMEDVIFSGTNGRPPMGMAEVSLTLLNDNGSAPEELKDFTEIMLTRRLYRSGESAYLINKQPCRLKDIHNVFLGSGMGSKSYSVIQQGNVGAITDAGPDERRYFIEEAAGITRYKNRKTEALRKVESTKQNLLRVMDITAELNRQMGGLKRQAKKAEVYQRLYDRIRYLDIYLGLNQYEEITSRRADAAGMLNRLQDKDQRHATQLMEFDAEVERIKLKRQEQLQRISDQKSELHDIQRSIDKMENDLSHLRNEKAALDEEITGFESVREEIGEKNADMVSEIDAVREEHQRYVSELDNIREHIENEQKASRQVEETLAELNHRLDAKKAELMNLVAEEAKYKSIYQNAAQNIENLKRRLKKIGEEEYTASANVTRLEREIQNAEEELESVKCRIRDVDDQTAGLRVHLEEQNSALTLVVKQLQALEKEKHQADSKYAALRKMQDSYQWYKDGVRAIMKRAAVEKGNRDQDENAGPVIGLIADILEPESSFETAVEAVLGESLQYILISGQQAGIDAIKFLAENTSGRSGFVPVLELKDTWCDSWKKPYSSKLLLNHISIKPGYERLAHALLGNVVIVDDLQRAIDVYHQNECHQAIVTKDGNVITPQGIMIGGSKENLAGILEKKYEMRQLESRISELENLIAESQREFEKLENVIRGLENDLQKLLENKHKLSRDEVEAEKSLYKISEDLRHAKTHLEIVRLEQEQLMGEEDDINEEMDSHTRTLADIENRVKNSQEDVARASHDIDSVSNELESYNRKIVDLKLSLTEKNAGFENSAHTLRRLQDFYEEGKKRLAQLTSDIEQKQNKKRLLEKRIEESGPRLEGMYTTMDSLHKEIEIAEVDYQTIDEALKSSADEIEGIRNEREQILRNIRLIEVEKSQLEMKRENLANRLTERYQLPFSELSSELASISDRHEDCTRMSLDQMNAEMARCRSKIEKIQDVNLGAIKEFEQLKIRFDFLEEQRADLENAIANLYKVIRKINRITQEKFLKTFNDINEKLNVVFPKLFEGGTAKLVMTDPQNPLDTGVEFMIHPPGKKLTRLSLLSGGEKALSAIAFIFSIYLIRPTSFCLMDEIDAPLDDANVFRFNDLLKIIGEKSQIIMITHNKNSMEFADSLFGVTMEKKGVSKLVSVNFERQEARANQDVSKMHYER
ncbi:MAG: chromosome segregation protein SMC [Desulfobacterales bacterium]